MSPFRRGPAVATMAGMSAPPPKPRRWQVGERAVCSCDGLASEICPVVSGAPRGGHPTVERGGAAHLCVTAVYAAAKMGRPRLETDGGELARVSPELAEEMRRVIRAAGATEREFLESAIAASLARIR